MMYVSEDELRNEIVKIQKSNRLKAIAETLKDDNITNELKDSLIIEQQDLFSKGYVEKYPKTNFGQMVLDIVRHRAMTSKFASYTYRDEFLSNAIEKIMSYSINNFDENYVNPKTGVPSKAFSYITEIASRAFVAVINDMKAENEMLNEYLSLDSVYQHLSENHKNGEMFVNSPTKSKQEEPKDTHSIELDLKWEDGLTFEDKRYSTLYELLLEYENHKLKVIYPNEYKIDIEEYSKINSLKFEYINIVQLKPERYMPSFPKKHIKEKENLIQEWE